MTTTKARTERIPGVTASQGAVRQSGGTLPVYRCTTCHDEVVWAESKRTGRRYLVNVSTGYHGQRFYVGANVHDCEKVQAGRAAIIDKDRASRAGLDYVERIQAAEKAGDRDEALRLLDEWTHAEGGQA